MNGVQPAPQILATEPVHVAGIPPSGVVISDSDRDTHPRG